MSDRLRCQQDGDPGKEYDVIIIGAGVAGMYGLYHLRKMGLSVKVYDGSPEVGGTWYHNGYPGARIDGPNSPYYCYTFSDELMQEWEWKETHSDQPMILAYLKRFADKYDLRKDIQLDTRVDEACYDEGAQRWTVNTSTGESASAQFLICALGVLSAVHKPDIPGFEDYTGECYHSGNWPQEAVSFEGRRVGIIGTGSTGTQLVTEIAKTAGRLTVFQRTPQYTVPARMRPLDPKKLEEVRANWPEMREQLKAMPTGMPMELSARSALEDTPEERQKRYEEMWQKGDIDFYSGCYSDVLTNEEANFTMAEFVRGKIAETVKDPETARKLMPDHFICTKRPILDHGYYETYNRDNVTLVDLREDPIEKITATGICTEKGEHELDMIVLATGYDSLTGSILRLNPKGRGGTELKDKWRDSFDSYLGLGMSGFPNLFQTLGAGSPGILYNQPLGAEQQIDWIGKCIEFMREKGLGTIEASPEAEKAWVEEITAIGNQTLFPKTDSWFVGANIPGKPRQFAMHAAGYLYFPRILDVAENGYEGFVFEEEDDTVIGDAS